MELEQKTHGLTKMLNATNAGSLAEALEASRAVPSRASGTDGSMQDVGDAMSNYYISNHS